MNAPIAEQRFQRFNIGYAIAKNEKCPGHPGRCDSESGGRTIRING